MHDEPDGTGYVAVMGHTPLAPFPIAVTENNFKEYFQNPAIAIEMDTIMTRMNITINTLTDPAKKVIAGLKTIAQKYNKTLEFYL